MLFSIFEKTLIYYIPIAMRFLIKTILIIELSIEVMPAQFINDLEPNSIPWSIHNQDKYQSSLSFLDPSRFNINHSFTMSMISGSQGMLSLAGLSNNISYLVLDNLKVDANVTVYKAQMALDGKNQLDLSFDAAVTYKPTKNSFLQLRFQNIPHYQKYQTQSPYNIGLIR